MWLLWEALVLQARFLTVPWHLWCHRYRYFQAKVRQHLMLGRQQTCPMSWETEALPLDLGNGACPAWPT